MKNDKQKKQLQQYKQLLHALASARYDAGFFKQVRQAHKLATQLDAKQVGSHETQLYVALQRNPNQPLAKMEEGCQKKPLTGDDIIGLLRPVLYSAGLGLAFAFCSALMTSVIGSVVALVATAIAVLYPVIKKLIIHRQQRQFLQRAKSMLVLLQLPTMRQPQRQQPQVNSRTKQPINIFFVSVFCQQSTASMYTETAHKHNCQQLLPAG